MKLSINGQERVASHIAFDDCHKIYLINSEDTLKEAKNYGYKPTKATPEDLQKCWDNSCPLRFIQVWNDDYESVVPQAYNKEVIIL